MWKSEIKSQCCLRFQCALCPAVFDAALDLMKHFSFEHTLDHHGIKYKFCREIFFPENMSAHLLSVHGIKCLDTFLFALLTRVSL